MNDGTISKKIGICIWQLLEWARSMLGLEFSSSTKPKFILNQFFKIIFDNVIFNLCFTVMSHGSLYKRSNNY